MLKQNITAIDYEIPIPVDDEHGDEFAPYIENRDTNPKESPRRFEDPEMEKLMVDMLKLVNPK